MQLNTSDDFVNFLVEKSHNSWSTMEVLEIFKHHYGSSDKNALANMLMDVLATYTKKPRKTKRSKEYAKMWAKELASK